MTESGQAIRPISYSLKAFIGIDDNFAIAIAWISSIETASSKDKELQHTKITRIWSEKFDAFKSYKNTSKSISSIKIANCILNILNSF